MLYPAREALTPRQRAGSCSLTQAQGAASRSEFPAPNFFMSFIWDQQDWARTKWDGRHVAPSWALTDWDGSRVRGAQLGAHKEGM